MLCVMCVYVSVYTYIHTYKYTYIYVHLMFELCFHCAAIFWIRRASRELNCGRSPGQDPGNDSGNFDQTYYISGLLSDN